MKGYKAEELGIDVSQIDCSKCKKLEDYIPVRDMLQGAKLPTDWSERIDDCDPPCVPVNTASDTPWQSKIAVKISIYKDWHVEEVVYYRYAMPLPIVRKWQWYFEYLAALVKVHNPRRKVELIIVSQDVLGGDDYIAKKTKTLLQAKRSQLKQAQNKRINDDLFGHTSLAHQSKLDGLRDEIEALERGEERKGKEESYV